jgi:hypothetical protein
VDASLITTKECEMLRRGEKETLKKKEKRSRV